MDAVILAAGLGTRLRPHTLHTPKPLLPIQGRPILDWALGALPPAVDRVVVVVHYLAEQVEAYLRGQKHFAEWVTVPQDEPRGTGDALRRRPGRAGRVRGGSAGASRGRAEAVRHRLHPRGRHAGAPGREAGPGGPL